MLVHISVFVCIGGGDMVGGCVCGGRCRGCVWGGLCVCGGGCGGCVCGGCVGVVCEWGDGDGSENYSLKIALSFTGSHTVPL